MFHHLVSIVLVVSLIAVTDGMLSVDIIRKYNPNVKGYSVCQSTEDNVEKSWFNVAQPGGTCELVSTDY